MNVTDRKNIVIHYKTTADLRAHHEHFVRVADGHPLPEEISDLVSATVSVRPDGKTWVTVEFI
jgi:hypothetical protein